MVEIQPKNTRKLSKTRKNPQNVSKIVYFWPILTIRAILGTLGIHLKNPQVPWPWGTLGFRGCIKNSPKSSLGLPQDMRCKKNAEKWFKYPHQKFLIPVVAQCPITYMFITMIYIVIFLIILFFYFINILFRC